MLRQSSWWSFVYFVYHSRHSSKTLHELENPSLWYWGCSLVTEWVSASWETLGLILIAAKRGGGRWRRRRKGWEGENLDFQTTQSSSNQSVAILQSSYLSRYARPPFPWSCFSFHLTRIHFPSVSPAAATRTLTDILLWSGRHSAATSAVSMLRGSWSTTWTLFSSSKRSWFWRGSLRTVPSPSGWRRCWWVWAAPACPPSSATWPKPRPDTDGS